MGQPPGVSRLVCSHQERATPTAAGVDALAVREPVSALQHWESQTTSQQRLLALDAGWWLVA